MLTGPEQESTSVKLQAGNHCLLCVMGQHFQVRICEVSEETVRVSFPGEDYPIEGMPVQLQFHDEGGYISYESAVIENPSKRGEGLLLTKPRKARRNQHRQRCRVPTDLTVQVKDQVHIRRHDAALLDLSASGALISTDAPFDFGTSIELTLSLPGEPTRMILAQVIHITEAPPRPLRFSHLFGLRFVGLDLPSSQSLARYIIKRLKELYVRD